MANKKQRKARDRRVRQDQDRRTQGQPGQGMVKVKPIKGGRLYEDVGEDGLPMTHARNRMKRLLSAYTIWGFICIPVAACWFLLSCFSWQAWGLFSFLGYTDFSVNGYNPVGVLRIEAIITLLGLLSLLVNSFSFSWMFGQAPAAWFLGLTGVLGVIYAGYFAFCLSSYGLIEPVSLLNLGFLIAIWYSAWREGQERPYLG